MRDKNQNVKYDMWSEHLSALVVKWLNTIIPFQDYPLKAPCYNPTYCAVVSKYLYASGIALFQIRSKSQFQFPGVWGILQKMYQLHQRHHKQELNFSLQFLYKPITDITSISAITVIIVPISNPSQMTCISVKVTAHASFCDHQ
jgi:hypothetical protein